MGLDQYAFKRKPNDKEENQEEFAYWRKHANLQGWMENLFFERCGYDYLEFDCESHREFNCEYLRLHREDLENLANDYLSLDKAEGFFWGESQEEDDELTKKFIEDAIKYIDEGYEIYYYSWW